MRIFTLFLACLLYSLTISAQFETDYKPVVSRGELPSDFVTLSSQKYEAEKESLKSEKGKEKKKKEKFLLESNFGIDEVLLSGRILFNDPLAEYVNKVADKVLANDPETRGKLRIYILKSTSVNAFATNQGIVFVTVGMLAQLENEAQLAFILAHEAVHYKEKHAMQKFLEGDKIESRKGVYKSLSQDEKYLSKSAFSQQQEKEADEKGLQIFLTSKYSTAHLMGVYDVLKYSYLPFDDITFDKSFLENSTFKLPDDYYKKATLPIDVREIEDDDKRSTHPSITYRREKTQSGIANANNTGKQDYLVSETDFNTIRETARFEMCRLYKVKHRYESAIYSSYLLLKKYPNNLFLKKTVAYSLTAMAQYSDKYDFKDVHYNSDSIEGKSQAVFYLMFKLDSARSDLPITALAYVTKLKKEYPNDDEIDGMYKGLIKSLVTHNMHYVDFSNLPPSAKPEVIDTAAVDTVVATLQEDTDDGQGKSKYDKLREQANKVKKEGGILPTASTRYTTYAFVEFMNEPWFKQDFLEAEKHKDDVEADRLNAENLLNNGRYYWTKKKQFALGIDKAIVIDPYYARVDARKKDQYKFLESESGQVDFAERLKLNAKKAKLDLNVLSTKDLDASETDKINDIAVMQEYISDRLATPSDVDLPYCEHDRVKAIAAKYGSDYFIYTGAISLTEKSRAKAGLIVMSILVPPTIVFNIPNLVSAGQYTLYFTLVYDVKTDELKMVSSRELNNSTNPVLLNSHMYDVLHQVKTTAKAK